MTNSLAEVPEPHVDVNRRNLCAQAHELLLVINMPPEDPYPSPPPSPARIDPVLRNALRYTISAKEYKTLHEYLITRAPPAVRKRAPAPPKYSSIVQSKDDFNIAAVRTSLRVFVATQTGLKLWDLITTNLLGKARVQK